MSFDGDTSLVAKKSEEWLITDTSGYLLIAERDVTEADYIALCKELAQAAKPFNPGDFSIRPEPCYEGGFVFEGEGFGFRANEKYKTMRTMPEVGRLPYVGNLTEDTASDEVVIPEGRGVPTHLKASGGAILWSLPELRAWLSAFEKFGLTKRGIFPWDKALVTYLDDW